MAQRWKLTVEFDGRPFVGWQRQGEGLSVQGVLEAAILGFSHETVRVFTAGRTDAGVHALAIVCHFDLEKPATAHTVREALNFHLKPHPVSVLHVEAVGEDFHARFSCLGRSYRYRIINRRAPLSLDQGRAWWVRAPLDVDAMNAAAALLLGTHDFTSFRAAQCQANSPIKTLDVLSITREGEEINVVAKARSFLHHQVRNMVGTLKYVGEGAWPVERVAQALAAKNRSAAGLTAPPDGLYFTGAFYPE